MNVNAKTLGEFFHSITYRDCVVFDYEHIMDMSCAVYMRAKYCHVSPMQKPELIKRYRESLAFAILGIRVSLKTIRAEFIKSIGLSKYFFK